MKSICCKIFPSSALRKSHLVQLPEHLCQQDDMFLALMLDQTPTVTCLLSDILYGYYSEEQGKELQLHVAGLTASQRLSEGHYSLLADVELKGKIMTLNTSHPPKWKGQRSLILPYSGIIRLSCIKHFTFWINKEQFSCVCRRWLLKAFYASPQQPVPQCVSVHRCPLLGRPAPAAAQSSCSHNSAQRVFCLRQWRNDCPLTDTCPDTFINLTEHHSDRQAASKGIRICWNIIKHNTGNAH